MNRGDVVIVAARGPFTGKPRPAVVVQSDDFNPTHASVTVCLISSDLVAAPAFRIAVPGGAETGLLVDSQVMVDKLITLHTDRLRDTVGRIEAGAMAEINDALRRWLSL